MKYVLLTDAALPAAIVAKAALPGEEVAVACADRKLATELRADGHSVIQGSLSRNSTWEQLELDDDTLVVISLEDDAACLAAVEHAMERVPETPVLVLDMADRDRGGELESQLDSLRNVERVRLSDMVRAPFQREFESAVVRRRVHQWRDHFDAGERIVILLHDDPDPDALAAALALRALLGRNRQTASIGTFKAPTRPENLRMIELLDIDVLEVTEEDVATYDRIAVVDTQPHIFEGKVTDVDLVVDHHPPRSGYTSLFRDVRTAFGATTTMLLDMLMRYGIPLSERLATAAVYAIKTDTWSFRRGAVPEDIAVFAHVFPRADQSLLRKIEMEGFTLEAMRFVAGLTLEAELVGGFLHVHAGEVERDDIVPTSADFLMHCAEARWTAVSGVLGDVLTISVRNLGQQKPAGELVQRVYAGLGSSGGHRSAAKALLDMDLVRKKFGDPSKPGFSRKLFKPLWEAAGEGGKR
jgi:nanoRNase/pAp phosphatase (c-di-AMP/oligoRNAs hydrolase)